MGQIALQLFVALFLQRALQLFLIAEWGKFLGVQQF